MSPQGLHGKRAAPYLPLCRSHFQINGFPTNSRTANITGGVATEDIAWDEWHVPKRDVVTALQVALQEGCFRVAKALPDAETLVREARNFQWKVSKAGNDLYGAWREGQHDDLLLAAAVAVWWGQRTARRPRAGGVNGSREPHAGPNAWML